LEQQELNAIKQLNAGCTWLDSQQLAERILGNHRESETNSISLDWPIERHSHCRSLHHRAHRSCDTYGLGLNHLHLSWLSGPLTQSPKRICCLDPGTTAGALYHLLLSLKIPVRVQNNWSLSSLTYDFCLGRAGPQLASLKQTYHSKPRKQTFNRNDSLCRVQKQEKRSLRSQVCSHFQICLINIAVVFLSELLVICKNQ
jgi:hypothetical protein